LWGRREPVYALESAGVAAFTDGFAVQWVNTVCIWGGIVDQSRQNVADCRVSSNFNGQESDQVSLNEERKGRQTKADIEYTNDTQYPQQVRDYKLCVKTRAHVDELSCIKGMWCWLSRLEGGRASSEEQAESRKKTE